MGESSGQGHATIFLSSYYGLMSHSVGKAERQKVTLQCNKYVDRGKYTRGRTLNHGVHCTGWRVIWG